MELPRYSRIKNGRLYFEPSAKDRRLYGFAPECLGGADDPAAIEKAKARFADVLAARGPKDRFNGITEFAAAKIAKQLAAGGDVKIVPGIDEDAMPALPRRSDPKYSIRALADLLVKEPKWKAYAPTTRWQYEFSMRNILAEHGGKDARKITRRDMKNMRDAMKAAGRSDAVINGTFTVWRILFHLAVDEGWRGDNPAIQMQLKAPKARTQLWTDEEVAAFVAAADRLGKPAMGHAVLLARHSALSRVDVQQLRWEDVQARADEDGSTVLCIITQRQKTKLPVMIAAAPELAAVIGSIPRRGDRVITRGNGKPYSISRFAECFTEIRRAAGLGDHLHFHDLRRTMISDGTARGLTPQELATMAGWTAQTAATRMREYSPADLRTAFRVRKALSKTANVVRLERFGKFGKS